MHYTAPSHFIKPGEPDFETHFRWIEQAAFWARYSKCSRAHCGSVIVSDELVEVHWGKVIGVGFNGQAGTNISFTPHRNRNFKLPQPRCNNREFKPGFNSDKTCCVHAEQRAIMDALMKHGKDIVGAALYFCRVDMETGQPQPSGPPRCTICSKMALDVQLSTFVLWHGEEKGLGVYPTVEYNELSFEYGEESPT